MNDLINYISGYHLGVFQECTNPILNQSSFADKSIQPQMIIKKKLIQETNACIYGFFIFTLITFRIFSILRISHHPILLLQSAPLNFLVHFIIRQFLNFKYPQNEKENFNHCFYCSCCFFHYLLCHPEKRLQSHTRDAWLWQSLIFIKRS